jgi:hypothetical protein
MTCQRCESERVAFLSTKSSDRNYFDIGDAFQDQGYVPVGAGIGGDDYVEIHYCLDCGQLQGNFPLPPIAMELAPAPNQPIPSKV